MEPLFTIQRRDSLRQHSHQADPVYVVAADGVEVPSDELRDELPELVRLCDALNAAPGPADPTTYGVVDGTHERIKARSCDPVILKAEDAYIPVDGRGRWISAMGLSSGEYPMALAVESVDKLAPRLGQVLHSHYATQAGPHRMTAAEKVKAQSIAAAKAKADAATARRAELLAIVASACNSTPVKAAAMVSALKELLK